MQEQHQHDHRQCSADEDVLLHEVDRGMDVVRLVVDLHKLQPAGFQNLFIDLGPHLAETFHDVEHVGSRFANAVHRDARFAKLPNDSRRLAVTVANLGNVPHVDRRAVPHGNKLVLDLFFAAELAERPDDPAAFAFPVIAGGRVFVLRSQHAAQILNGDLPGRQPLGIDDHLHLVIEPAINIRLRNAGYAFEPRFDFVFGKTPHFHDVDGFVRQQSFADHRMFFGQSPQSQHGQTHVVRAANGVQLPGQFRMLILHGRDLLVGRPAGAQDEPGDRTVARVRRGDDRLVRVFRVFGNLLQPRVHLEQRFVDVRSDVKLERHGSLRIGRVGGEFDQALDALQLLFLLDDDFAFDLLRTGARPARFDADRRPLDFRRQLHRHPHESNRTKQRDEQDADSHLDRVMDNRADGVHTQPLKNRRRRVMA